MVPTPNIGVLMSKPNVKTIEKLKSYVTFEEDHAVDSTRTSGASATRL
jgi:hypothetical protein